MRSKKKIKTIRGVPFQIVVKYWKNGPLYSFKWKTPQFNQILILLACRDQWTGRAWFTRFFKRNFSYIPGIPSSYSLWWLLQSSWQVQDVEYAPIWDTRMTWHEDEKWEPINEYTYCIVHAKIGVSNSNKRVTILSCSHKFLLFI